MNRVQLIPLKELSLAYTHGAAASSCYREVIAHACRMVRPAQAAAMLLGLSQEEIHLVGLAALLHDLGKIVIPTAILSKSGPLTQEDWAVVRRHPETGSQMLLHAGGDLGKLAPIVLAHHERWDGGGYPCGLARDAIPLAARILFVVDAYDAMTSPRVYQRHLSHEEARTELRLCAGQQLDPRVVAAFLRVLDGQELAQARVSSVGQELKPL